MTAALPKASDERSTPDDLYALLHAEFGFAWDAAALNRNRKPTIRVGGRPVVAPYFGPDHPLEDYRDGLAAPWRAVLERWGLPLVVWNNPPYSRGQVIRWCEKAKAAADDGVTVVQLLPADMSTRAWHEYIRVGERRELTCRLPFDGAPLDASGRLAPARFPSVLRIWRPRHPYWSWG